YSGSLSFSVVVRLVKLHSDRCCGFPPLLMQFRAAESLGFLLTACQIDTLAQRMRGVVAGRAACSQFSRDAGAALTEELDLFTGDMGQLDMVLLMSDGIPQGADITFQFRLIDGVCHSQQLENRLVRERNPGAVGTLGQVH